MSNKLYPAVFEIIKQNRFFKLLYLNLRAVGLILIGDRPGLLVRPTSFTLFIK
jgi:hypothetical protein